MPRVLAMRQAGYCDDCRLVRRQDAIRILGIAASTITDMIRRGQITNVRTTTRTVMLHRADLEGVLQTYRLTNNNRCHALRPVWSERA